jgi:hypothetical protein
LSPQVLAIRSQRGDDSPSNLFMLSSACHARARHD